MLEDDLPTTLMRLGLATVLGLALGCERERRGHDAGLRTHGLVALSSGMLTLSALELVEHHAEGDPVRVIQGLAQAIGFIAGGLIFVRGGDVRNMTTAASLWMAAAVGITAGAGQYILVLAGTALALLLLVAASLVERYFPAKEDTDSQQTTQMPNRRGAAVPPPSSNQLNGNDE
ncbi:MgtC/SapB family protein (plasmid) [Novosphingobium resinovorum]|jgi:putative Mg2+ transporter-C (MgtC) family protein|uniref:Protein MgtC n=1 Tax=Novosphingobium resinovorum TaxID=158500 RepID=A0A1D8AF24_9SPHN|nr:MULTISPECIES: MgtC/SapB family protein [Sphingomonadaceae]AOR80699.1 magnesium transporter MgtC [Novosphingobium resinovorum]EJU14187.1 MgtC/SapB family transporter [Sphingomonas sp. LH128]MBF7015543.1 MgtC/SapB family protein [Novosphingobium sp. HR1a]WJM30219.1 MgtC/SapB family protein [Novosphingobium resinovorum]